MKAYNLYILFTIFFVDTGRAQQNILTYPVTITQVELPLSFTDLVERFEKSGKIKFFFHPDWISHLEITRAYSEIPLGIVLNQIFEGLEISYSVFQNYAIILLKDHTRSIEIEQLLTKAIAERKSIQQVRIGSMEDFSAGKHFMLKGAVVDEKTGSFVKNVSISVLNGDTGTETNELGQYELVLPSREYLISFRHTNYSEKIVDLQLNANGRLDIELEEIAILLEDIIVTDQPIVKTGIGQLRIKTVDMKRSPTFLGETDLIKHVQAQAGVTTVGEVAAGFNVRGGGVDQNLILLDGIPVFNPSHALGFFSAFDADIINRVSFYKSGIPAEYGGRVSSVMNMSTKEGNYNRWSGSGGVGIIAAHANIHGPLKIDTTSVMASFRTTYSNWMLDKIRSRTGIPQNSSLSFYDGSVKLTHKFSNQSKITFSGYLSRDQTRFITDTLFQWDNQTASIRWDKVRAENLFYSLTLGLGRYAYVLQKPSAFQGFNLKYSITYPTFKADFNYTRKRPTAFGAHIVSYNLNPGTLSAASSQSSIKPIVIPGEHGVESALYYSESFTWRDRIFIDAGVRYVLYARVGPGKVYRYLQNEPLEPQNIIDSLSYGTGEIMKTFHGPEPRLSMRYTINQSSSIKIGYNRIHQFVHLISNTAAITPVDVWQASNIFFRPQLTDQVSSGYFRNLKEGTYEASGEVFYKYTDNILEFKDGAQLILNERLETSLLPGYSRSYGIELSVSKIKGKLLGSINYTWSRSWRRINGSTDIEQINSGEWYPSNFDQPHVVNASWRLGITRRHFFSGTFIYHTGRPISLPAQIFYIDGIAISNFPYRNTYRLPDYHRLDLAFIIEGNHKRKKLWDGTWIVSAYNVYSRRNAYSVFFSQNEQGVLKPYQLSVVGAILTTVTYNFKF